MSFDPLLGLTSPTPGDPAVKNAWGSLLNTNFTLIGQAITGDNGYGGGAGGISIAGQNHLHSLGHGRVHQPSATITLPLRRSADGRLHRHDRIIGQDRLGAELHHRRL